MIGFRPILSDSPPKNRYPQDPKTSAPATKILAVKLSTMTTLLTKVSTKNCPVYQTTA